MLIELPTDAFYYPETPLPDVWTIEQLYDTPALSDREIEASVRAAVSKLLANAALKPGAEIAVGVGSRGLDNLVTVVRSAVATLRANGLAPFIIPAMGSHGGATAEGQKHVLEGYGITPEQVGAEIRATMETVEVGTLSGAEAGSFDGHPVYCDANAFAVDAILLINRIKAHTDFSSDMESGIGKMSAIGLGKQKGAAGIHRYGARGLRELLPRVARFQASSLKLLGGVAMLENELGHTAEIHPLLPNEIANRAETALLERARAMGPKLPFDQIDVLIIDEMGKNISGTGMDTHVIGRVLMPSISETEWGGPDIRIIIVLDLTRETDGNATALGLADIVTRRLMEKVNWQATMMNMSTSGEGGILKSRIPLVMETGEDAVRAAIATSGRFPCDTVRLARIRSTMDLRRIEVSEPLLADVRANARLKIATGPAPFDLCRHIS